MYTCYHCGKGIKGAITNYVPPNISIALGCDFAKAYHPACYNAVEKAAERELFQSQDLAIANRVRERKERTA